MEMGGVEIGTTGFRDCASEERDQLVGVLVPERLVEFA
jgi:hypothetical protein